MEAPPSFLTLPMELTAEILRRLPDFTALFKVTSTCTHIRKLFERFSDTIVWAIFENLWLRIAQTYRATLPHKIKVSRKPISIKLRREWIRKQSKPTSSTAQYCQLLFDELRLVIERPWIPKVAVLVFLNKAQNIGFCEVLLDRLLARNIHLRGLIDDHEDIRRKAMGDTIRSTTPKPHCVDPDVLILMDIIEKLTCGANWKGPLVPHILQTQPESSVTRHRQH